MPCFRENRGIGRLKTFRRPQNIGFSTAAKPKTIPARISFGRASQTDTKPV
ncbi:hypothetical protein [Neisseria montereyensis]|uniref:Uncharacterized protein n=1 Tax=Neisseria montereyensis TaxID=2973938 RepID=A0ABT2FAU8_9NEIS|nr:hypothetical protein [Neisseria montereyensis]MCS4533287.1 hypothetical protein [Neisseria montereyensis]